LKTVLKDYLALFFTIVISLILIYSNDNNQLSVLRVWLLNCTGWFQEQASIYSRVKSVYQDNRKLQKENTEYAFELMRSQEALLENVRLRKLLHFMSQQPYEFVPASVIGSGLTRNVNTLLLNRGKLHGLQKNMPVVTAEGMVGKLLTVSDEYSHAHILYDRYFRVSAKVQRTRVNGILSWESGRFLLLNQISKRMDVQEGDVIITSGFSLIFPEGIKIGMVVQIDDSEKGLFKRILVQPAVELTQLEEVLVIKGTR